MVEEDGLDFATNRRALEFLHNREEVDVNHERVDLDGEGLDYGDEIEVKPDHFTQRRQPREVEEEGNQRENKEARAEDKRNETQDFQSTDASAQRERKHQSEYQHCGDQVVRKVELICFGGEGIAEMLDESIFELE